MLFINYFLKRINAMGLTSIEILNSFSDSVGILANVF